MTTLNVILIIVGVERALIAAYHIVLLEKQAFVGRRSS
jgi:hypothetical protein